MGNLLCGKAERGGRSSKHNVSRSSTVRKATSPLNAAPLEHDDTGFKFFSMTQLHLKRLNKIGCHSGNEPLWGTARRASETSLDSNGARADGGDPPATTALKEEVIRPSFSEDHAEADDEDRKRRNSEAARAAKLVEEGVIDADHASAYIDSQKVTDDIRGTQSNNPINSSNDTTEIAATATEVGPVERSGSKNSEFKKITLI